MSVFRLYNENRSIAFDNSNSVFGLIKAGRLTRPNPTDTPSKLKNYWFKQLNDPIITDIAFREYRKYYRNNANPAKDFYDVYLKNVQYRDKNNKEKISDLRPLRGFLEKRYISDDFYLAGKSYYIDVVCESTPIVFLHCDMPKPKYSGLLYKLDYDESPFLGLTHSYTKKLSDNLYRVVYVSAMPLSDRELERFRVYVFGLSKQKADKVGLNLYDEQGNLTFSSANSPLKVSIKPLKLSKNPNDRKVFINENGWQDNPLGDYTFCNLEANRRYAVMGGGLTELIDRQLSQKNTPFDISPRDSFGWKVHYYDWDWLSSPQFGVAGLIGGITAFLGSGYYQYAQLDHRTTAQYIEFDWRNPNKTHVELLVTDVTDLPFPFN